ncbi:hypothetical protein QQ045_007466 [Rhodiola kirilowii]
MDPRDASIHSWQQPQWAFMSPHYRSNQHFQNTGVTMGGGANYGSNLMENPNFPFNSISAPKPVDSGSVGHHQLQQPQPQHYQQPQPQHHQQQQQNGSPVSGGSSGTPTALGAEQAKRKRGRPRKYPSDGGGLGLSSNSPAVSMEAGGGGGQQELGVGNGEGSQGRRQRGRPPGSGKKQMDALGGQAGVGFTPHIINISPKENIVAKMVEFSQEGPRTICILSAYGSICSVTLRVPATDGSRTASYEGLCDIISLSGSFCCVNDDGSHNDRVNMTVALVTADGKYLGGGVAGELIAETDVTIIAGSFISERKKSNDSIPTTSSPIPSSVPQMLRLGGSATPNSAVAQLDAPNDCEDDNGGNGIGSHSLNHIPQLYNNHGNHSIDRISVYQPQMEWGNSGMHPNQ